MAEISGKLLTKSRLPARYPVHGMDTAGLNEAIERLYSIFGRYPLRARIDSCPCCRGPHETQHLHTKALKDLTTDDLGLYAFRAMTTVGDADDFRHFLPRILELVLSAEFPVDREVVLGKLRFAKWTEWPADESRGVRTYLAELWIWARRQPPDPYPYISAEIGSWLCAIAMAEDDLGPYLEAWAGDGAQEAQANLSRFISDERHALEGAKSPAPFWEEAPHQWQQVKTWVMRHERTGDSS